jgi:DnaJ-class molecular chaperone
MKQNQVRVIDGGNELVRNRERDQERVCSTCDGAGLLPCNENIQSSKTKLCTSCNGHGVILYTEFQRVPKIIRYGITDEAKCRFEN